MFAFRSILETSGRCHTPIAWALCRDELSDELFYVQGLTKQQRGSATTFLRFAKLAGVTELKTNFSRGVSPREASHSVVAGDSIIDVCELAVGLVMEY